MVLGKLPVPGRPTILITVGQGPIALAVGAGGGGLDIFTLIYPSFPLSPSLWETARYRLKYCLKRPLNPKPTNQIVGRPDTGSLSRTIAPPDHSRSNMRKMLVHKVSWKVFKVGLKTGIFSYLQVYMRVCEYKRSRSFFDL